MSTTTDPRLRAYVGCYADGPGGGPGGINVLDVSADGRRLSMRSHLGTPEHAGYVVYSPKHSTLYAVDERKTDGRGPVQAPAAVHALTVDSHSGDLAHVGRQVTVGAFPTFLSVADDRGLLFSANHGSFDHVERIVADGDGGWHTEYVYDDSAVVAYSLTDTGAIDAIVDVCLFTEGGEDPNRSLQAGGHAQASGHAHCAVIDPSGRYVVVCDKASERITVLSAEVPMKPVTVHQFGPYTGPRHIAFDHASDRAYVTTEFSSELVALRFDAIAGGFTVLDRASTTAADFAGPNEPAEVRVHPSGRWVYVNNRGEDTLAWFEVADNGTLTRRGYVDLAASPHPGLAARSFAFDPTGHFLLLADRPANLVRSYAVDAGTGALQSLTDVAIRDPAYIEFVELI